MRYALLLLLLISKTASAQLPVFPDSLKNTLIATLKEGDSLVIIEAFKIYESKAAAPHKPAIIELTQKNRRAITLVSRYCISRQKTGYVVTLYKQQEKIFPNKTIKHISPKKAFYTWKKTNTVALSAAEVLDITHYCHTQLVPSKRVNVDDKNTCLLVFIKNNTSRKLFRPRNDPFYRYMNLVLGGRFQS
jgi:hypothetical protein